MNMLTLLRSYSWQELKQHPWRHAAAVVAATGGSTNATLHLPALAHEAGIAFDLFDVA